MKQIIIRGQDEKELMGKSNGDLRTVEEDEIEKYGWN